jgi:3-hydroxybutyryl-CoA dehydrogenase
MDIRKIGIIGAGQMGNGIAHVAAVAGIDVVMVDVSKEALAGALDKIQQNLSRQVKRGKISEADAKAAVARIQTADSYAPFKECDVVIEAATENETIKRDILKKLCPQLRSDAIIASNTSSISITRLAASTDRPEKFIGMHFMNPVPMMKLIELIRGIATSNETFAVIEALSKRLGKIPVQVNDYPGFIANRILMPMINEAIYAHMEGVGTVEAIDEVMRLGAGHPMGPFTLADFIGLDVCLAILEVMHDGLGDPKYRPCPLLKKMVQAGYLGRKTKRGFYKYE